MTTARMHLLTVSIAVFLTDAALAQCPGQWTLPSESWPGPDGPVYAAIVFNDELYIGGDFQHVGTLAASGVAKWNGTQWAAVGDGLTGVTDFAVFADRLYAAGPSFFRRLSVNNRWFFLGMGSSPIAANGDSLFVSMVYNMPGIPEYENEVASYNGTVWQQEVVGGFYAPIDLLETPEGLYWLSMDAIPSPSSFWFFVKQYWNSGGCRPTCWDGSWGTEPTDWFSRPLPYALGYFDGDVFVGGEFNTEVPGQLGVGLARISDTGSGPTTAPNGAVRALSEFAGEFYVAGTFDTAGPTPAHSIARWTRSGWQPLGDGIEGGEQRVLATYRNELYVGGNFSTVDGQSSPYLAKWTLLPAPSDLNSDGSVELADLAVLLSNFGRSDASPQDGDVNRDHTVDLSDLALLLHDFGLQCP